MEEMYQASAPIENENLLDEFDNHLIQASSGKRFANMLIDHGLLYLLWNVFLGKYIGLAMYYLGLYGDGSGFLLKTIIVLYILDILYFAIMEVSTGGRTLGKLITRTRAVNEDASRINFKTALLRGASRMVPFEAFSALGSPCWPWHDRWTKTYVVDEAQSRLPE